MAGLSGLRGHRRSYAVSAASALIVIAPPPASLWARRIQNEQYPGRDDHAHLARHDDRHDDRHSRHLRADSSVLGFEQPRILGRAHVAAPTRAPLLSSPSPRLSPPPPRLSPPPPPLSPSSVYSADYLLPSPPATPSTISSPIGTPFHPLSEDYSAHPPPRLPQRLSALVPLEMSPRAPWLSRTRSYLRLVVIVLCILVVLTLLHTLGIYRGNRYLELRKGEIPMAWPARTNLVATIVLCAVAGANLLGSVAVAVLSFGWKGKFRRAGRARDLYRLAAGCGALVLWVAALVVFRLLDGAYKASLGRYSCANASRMTNGRYQYRAVCEEQNMAFYTAVGAASAELLTLLTLAASAISSRREDPPLPTIQIHEKRDSNHLSSAWKPSRPKTWIP